MNKEQWQKVKDLFEAAVGLSGEERDRFLNKECGDDSNLRAEVQKLIASFEAADTSFLEEPAEKEVISQILEQETQALNDLTTGEVKSGGFIAGTVLDKRYRIIGLLGKGGMGEVYKAEDLTLNQTVALKFLPDKLAKNEDALKRFIGEVKNARQVSHANVCKVFDIGEINGNRYLSMEFIDGDDLSQLLRRIGRLPSERAAEISRQICFGLHAIHDAGILHRDLKPANIIIDSNGKARITDFGIAGIEEEINSDEIRVGTPAYMSPEQITGKEVTQKSDIYSLGLLLYEIYTGKQAIRADSFEELVEKQKTTQPTNPSTFVENIEPVVEKTITRCLEKDPANRPKSALQVALALPGGNPLEAAIAAGETPSPEMVAAAPKRGALKPVVAFSILAIFFAATFGIIMLNQTVQSYAFTPFERSPEILREKAREIVKTLGYTEPPVDSDHEFVQNSRFLEYYGFTGNTHDLPPRREMLSKGQPFDFYFLYRQSPDYLQPIDSVEVTENEPPLNVPEMVNIKLDVRGRLIEFVAVPPPTIPAASGAEADWSAVFQAAELDITKFREADIKWSPPVFADKTKGWEGRMADFPDIPIRVETAEIGGKPVYFRIIAPWDSADGGISQRQSVAETQKIGIFLLILLISVAIIGSLFFAYRNIKAGRGDLRGGLKLTFVLFLLALFGQLLKADHIPTLWGELSIIYEAISYAGITASVVGILYIALEPYVRRSWPEMLISWSRLMAGDFRDPMVGRDILIGGLMGLGHMFGIHIGYILMRAFLGEESILAFVFLDSLNSVSGLFGIYLESLVSNTAFSLIVVFIALFFYLLTRKKMLGVLSVGLLFFILQVLIIISIHHWLFTFAAFINAVCLVVALGRYGLLGMISFWFFFEAIYEYPQTFDTSSFYFTSSTLSIIILLLIAAYAFHISIAGQPVFGGKILSDGADG
ncbi:MAG: serine/threonine-protein kinase [Pyrinomonadaceae bacterium]